MEEHQLKYGGNGQEVFCFLLRSHDLLPAPPSVPTLSRHEAREPRWCNLCGSGSQNVEQCREGPGIDLRGGKWRITNTFFFPPVFVI